MEEDAQQAMTQIKDYDGQRISLSVAKKKITDKKKTGVYEDVSPKLAADWKLPGTMSA